MASKGQTVEELLDQASALIEDRDYHHAVKCLHRAHALAPFRQDVRDMLAEAIDGRLAATDAPLDSDFSSRDFSKTREKPTPEVVRRKRGHRIGFGVFLVLLSVGLVGAVALAMTLSRISDESDEEVSSDLDMSGATTAEDLLAEAESALEERHYEDALALLEEAMAMGPADPTPIRLTISEVHSSRGRQRYDAGRYSRALEDYLAATDFNPDDFEPHYSMGWCHYYLARERSIAGDEDAAIGHYSDAVEAFEASLDIDRSMAKTHRSLGATLILMGDREGAFAAWNTAIRIDPTSAVAETARTHLRSHGMTPPED